MSNPERPRDSRLAAILKFIPKGSLPAVLSRGSNAGLAFLSTILLARVLGAETYGSYVLAITVAGLAGTIALGGLDQYSARTVSIAYHSQEYGALLAFTNWIRRRIWILSTVIVGIVLLGLLWNPMKWSETQVAASMIAVFAAAPIALLRNGRGKMQGTDRTALGLFFEMPFWNFLVILGAFLAFVVPSLSSAQGMVSWVVISYSISALVLSLIYKKGLPPESNVAPSSVDPVWSKISKRFAGIAVATFLLTSVDIFLVGTWLTETNTGIYGVTIRTAGLTLIVLQPIQQIIAPRVAKNWKHGNKEEAVRLARRCAQLSMVAGIPMLLFFAIFGGWFLGFFGEEFRTGQLVLTILALSFISQIAFGPGMMFLTMTGGERGTVLAALIGLSVLTIACIALIPIFGIVGAALARLGSQITTAGFSYGFVRWRKGVDIGWWQTK